MLSTDGMPSNRPHCVLADSNKCNISLLARKPNETELTVSLAYLEKQPNREHFINALINLNDFVMIR